MTSYSMRTARPLKIVAAAGLGTMLLFGVDERAEAAHPCTGAPNEIIVAYVKGPGDNPNDPNMRSLPLCQYTDQGPANPATPAPPPRIIQKHASIAWHADADQVWMAGNFDSTYGAMTKALEQCNAVMGGGCTSIGKWNNSTMAIARDWNGFLHNGWGVNASKAKQAVLEGCGRDQPLKCEIVGIYSASISGHSPDPRAVRKRYAAAAWLDDKNAPKGSGNPPRAWIATGHTSMNAATDAAIAACQNANNGLRCTYWGVVGNGVIQTYTGARGPGGLPELDSKRAVAAMKTLCASEKQKCTAQQLYSSREPGLFVHNYATGRSE